MISRPKTQKLVEKEGADAHSKRLVGDDGTGTSINAQTTAAKQLYRRPGR